MAAANEITLSASGNVELGDVSNEVVGTRVVQIVGAGWTGSIAVKGKVRGSPAANYVALPYTNRATDTMATAAITADALIEINSTGLDVRLDYTHTGGSVTIYTDALLG